MNLKKHGLPAAAAGVIVVILAVTAISVSRLSSDMREETRQALSTVLETTQQAVNSWVSEHEAAGSVWAQTPEVVSLTRELLETQESGGSLVDCFAQVAIRDWLRPVHTGSGYLGFFIIGRDLINLASSRDANVGTLSLLAPQSDFLRAIWSGGTAMSVPTVSDVPLPGPDGRLTTGVATMFVGVPVRDADGSVMAILTFRIDPTDDFTKIFQRGRIGATGETYAFDANGTLLSDSRFDEDLVAAGLLARGESGMLDIQVRDPGIDLTAVDERVSVAGELPLTRMAASAVRGEAGSDVRGYRDYRGVSVLGAWVWDDDLGFGITTEIDAAEGSASLRRAASMVGGNAVFSILLIVGLSLTIARSRNELLGEHRRMRTVLDLVPSRISVRRPDGTFILVNKAMAEAYGTTPEQFSRVDPGLLPRQSDESEEAERLVLEQGREVFRAEERFVDGSGQEHVLETVRIPYATADGAAAVLAVKTDITERRELEARLQGALAKALSGFLPICASCKQIRQDDGDWLQVEHHISQRTEAEFSHTICPGCSDTLYGDLLGPEDFDQ